MNEDPEVSFAEDQIARALAQGVLDANTGMLPPGIYTASPGTAHRALEILTENRPWGDKLRSGDRFAREQRDLLFERKHGIAASKEQLELQAALRREIWR